MINSLQFKPLTPVELPAVLELDKLCFGGLWTLEGYQKEMASDCSHFLLLYVDGVADISKVAGTEERSPAQFSHLETEVKLVGLGCFWSIVEEAHVTLLAIHPEYRRRGLGKLLLHSLLKKAREIGLERATLEVRSSNQSAISLYEKFGFKVAGKRPRYYQDNNEDALILWRGGLQYPQFGEFLEKFLGESMSISNKY